MVGAGRGGIVFAGEERGDALAIDRQVRNPCSGCGRLASKDAQFDGLRGDRLEACRIEAAIGAQNPQAGSEACSGCGRLARMALIKPSVLGPILPA